MSRSTTTETYVACRPGLLEQMKAAFDGMDVEVEDGLTQDYEFRQRELTGMDLVMAELQDEERMAADPKHAHTFMVPLLVGETSDLLGSELVDCQWLAVRTQDNVSFLTVQAALVTVKIQTLFDGEVDVSATISEIRQVLKDAGINVLSVSQAEGVTRLLDS